MNFNKIITRIGTITVAVVVMTMASSASAQNLQSVSNYSKTHEKLLAHQNRVQEQIRLKEAQEFATQLYDEDEPEPELDIYAEGWESDKVNAYRNSDIPATKVLDVSKYYMPIEGRITSRYGYRPRFRRMHYGIPNNRMTKVPDAAQPYIVARQGANNIFSMNCFGDVGLSLSLDSIPEGYTLTDLMENIRVISSYLTHVYKTDNSTELDIILSNDTTTEILHDLFDHQYNFYKNTRRNFNEEVTEDSVLNGYCRTIKKFLESTDFMGDLFNKMNIIRVDFPMAYSTELDIDQRLMCSMLLGGAKIAKAVPLMFDYSINMTAVKMKYFLAEDSNDILWIVPYTESPAEVDPKVLYDLTEERTTTIQNRLAKVIRAYDQSAAKETLSKI